MNKMKVDGFTGTVAVLAFLTAFWCIVTVLIDGALPRQQVQVTQPTNPAATAAWKKIAPRLSAADEAAHQAISKQCDRVGKFFNDRKQRARAFAEETLSYYSKWRFLKSKLPFTEADGHRQYLGEEFRRIVFSQDELEELLVSAVNACVAEWADIEGKAIRDVRADLADDALGTLTGGAFASDAAFREAYAKAVEQAAAQFKSDLKVWGGKEAVAQFGGALATPVLRSLAVSLAGRLGVSSAALGGGAASGAVTLGTGFVAGIIIDLLLDRLLRVFGYDPEAEIEQSVRDSIDYCNNLIVFGARTADFVEIVKKPFDPLARDEQPKSNIAGKPATRRDSQQKEDEGLLFHLHVLYATKATLRDQAIRALLDKGGAQ